MSEFFTYEPTVDRMSHISDLIDAEMVINRYDFDRIVDRRFKSGYRINPSHGVNIFINLIVFKNERYKLSQLWQVGKPKTHQDLGVYMVTSLSLSTATLIPVSISQNNDKKSIRIGNKLEFIYYGTTFKDERYENHYRNPIRI